MNKVALITGASRGIGRAITKRLAEDGYNVVINYMGSKEKAEALEQEISQEFEVEAISYQADVSDFNAVEAMVKATIERFGRIDVLVNNAGITKDSLLLRMSEEDFDHVLDINLKGTFNTIKHISKTMLKQRSGVIINMTSIIGLTGNIGQINYAASKAGVIAITKTVAKEFASRNIRCNAIAPGFIETEMTSKLDANVSEAILKNIPLGYFGSAQDVAYLVSFLVSDNARYITGQTIQVDGGMVM